MPHPSLDIDVHRPVGHSPRPSFEQLYAEHASFTWRVLRHLGLSDAAVEDALQELWVVVYQRRDAFEGRSAFKSWLFGIAINVVRNLRRSQRRNERHERASALADPTSTAVDPAERERQREAFDLVQGFLATLDEQRREVFVCVLLEEMSTAEAAAATGAPLDIIQNRVRALRRSFKTWLERRRPQ